MLKVSIIKNGQITNSAQFETQGELDAWLGFHVVQNTFGLPARPEMALNPETGIEEATGVILPAEYEIVQEDISAQVSQEQVNADALKFLAETDWKVLRHIRELNLSIPTSLSQQEYLQLEQDRAAAAASIVR